MTARIVSTDAPGVVAFLRAVFGASGEEHPDRPAEMRIGDSVVMVSGAGAARDAFPAFLYVYVDDADAAYARALAAGAVSLEAPADLPYGDRRAMVRDPWGNVWQIAHVLGAPEPTPAPLALHDLKVYTPAKDFELSKRFYVALGFTPSPGFGGTTDFELGGQRFRLQDYYVKDWADNFMFVARVDDVEAWHDRARRLAESGQFPGIRVQPPEPVEGAMVLHVVDPSGVLLIFVQ